MSVRNRCRATIVMEASFQEQALDEAGTSGMQVVTCITRSSVWWFGVGLGGHQGVWVYTASFLSALA